MHRLDDRYSNLGHVPNEELRDALNVIPALFWRIELANNRIEYLNSYQMPGLGDDTNLFLQNVKFSRDVIVEEDYYLFESFINSVKERKQTLTIVRIKHQGPMIHWIKLVGSPDPYRSNFYMGYMLDVSATVDIIRHIDKRGEGVADRIQLFDNPVVVCDFAKRSVRAANDAACEFFDRTREGMQTLQLENLFSKDFLRYQHSIYEDIIFQERWSGEMIIQVKGEVEYSADVGIRPLMFEGENLLWVSFYDISEQKGEGYVKEEFLSDDESYRIKSPEISAELEAIGAKGNLPDILSMLITYQPVPGLAESILYSDIHQEKNLVNVYGFGPSFENLSSGEPFPYEGTIAENIIKYNLDQIIVEDTAKSIKPIDWALFLPRGVRSYYAYPFYDEDELRTVLIFCSEKPNVFSSENVTSYHSLFPYFLKGLESWKANQG